MTSERSEAVLALGRKLVKHLEFESDNDLLAGWMAHYLAERMRAAESATPKDRAELEKQCAEAIFEVWAHRHKLEPAIPAFADLRALEGAILALEPDRKPFRYAAPLQGAISASQPSKEGRQWIELAAIIDDSARELIRYCLRRALDESIETGEAWLDTAREALGKDGPEQLIITFLRSGEDPAVKDLTARVAWLEARARKLDALVALSGTLAGELSEQVVAAVNELGRAEARASQTPKRSAKAKAKAAKT